MGASGLRPKALSLGAQVLVSVFAFMLPTVPIEVARRGRGFD